MSPRGIRVTAFEGKAASMSVLLRLKKYQFWLEGNHELWVGLISMESLIDFVRCDKPGIIYIEISGMGNIEQNNWRENRLLTSS